MKTLHIITTLTVGGAERFLYTLLSSNLGQVSENQVICLSDTGHFGAQLEALGITVTCLNMKFGSPSFSALLKLRKKIKQFKPDVIQGWMYHGNLMATISQLLSFNKAPVAWNVRYSLYDLSTERTNTQWVIRANKWLSGHAKIIIYNSKISRRQHENFGFKTQKGQVISNGFDVKKWTPNEIAKKQIRYELNVKDEIKLIGFMARFHVVKDVPNFLIALKQILSQTNNTECIMIGRNLGPENTELAPYFTDLPMHRIHILDERNDIPDILPALHVHCLSSTAESFPNSIGEAMACGVPCVCTDVGDSAHLIGETGIIVPPSDSQKLANAVLSLLSENKEDHTNRKIRARDRIVNNFSLSKISKIYLQLYKSLV